MTTPSRDFNDTWTQVVDMLIRGTDVRDGEPQPLTTQHKALLRSVQPVGQVNGFVLLATGSEMVQTLVKEELSDRIERALDVITGRPQQVVVTISEDSSHADTSQADAAYADAPHPDVGRARGVDQAVDQVTVLLAPPQQDDVDEFLGLLVQQILAEKLLDGLADGAVAILVPTDFLDPLILLDAQRLHVILGSASGVDHFSGPPNELDRPGSPHGSLTLSRGSLPFLPFSHMDRGQNLPGCAPAAVGKQPGTGHPPRVAPTAR